jgi:uncharacterized protein (DUF433 family)
MPAQTIPLSHVRLDEQGRAWIAGTTVKVIEVALDHLANGWSPEEIQYQHYGALSLAQIYAALSYYHDHRAEFDAEIQRQLGQAEALRVAAGESPFRKRLREQGRLR